jgi:NAD(P)-dependent dehydrogenase (short-subunit alcohol dehydrogenase family)
VVDANALPRTPAPDEVFDRSFLPARAERRPSSEGRAMDLQLKDKVVVITGPAKGMGRAVSLAFAAEGAQLVLTGRDVAAIEPVAAEARALGVAALVVPCDVTDAAQTEALAQAALARFGRIDVLVNVAGGSGPIGKTGWETTADEFNEIVELNMTGCFNTMHAVLPAMIEARSGKHRQRGRHLRHARACRAHGLFGQQVGPARHHQELCAGSRAARHQRQLRGAGHGRRAALPREGVRRHGAPSWASRSKRR